MSYPAFLTFKYSIEELLKKDQIEEALKQVFQFIEKNQPYYQTKLPTSKFIVLSATLYRQKKAFSLGLIEWDLTNRIRSQLVKECLEMMDIIDEDIKEFYDKRNYPSIGGFPRIFGLPTALENIENLLQPFLKRNPNFLH